MRLPPQGTPAGGVAGAEVGGAGGRRRPVTAAGRRGLRCSRAEPGLRLPRVADPGQHLARPHHPRPDHHERAPAGAPAHDGSTSSRPRRPPPRAARVRPHRDRKRAEGRIPCRRARTAAPPRAARPAGPRTRSSPRSPSRPEARVAGHRCRCRGPAAALGGVPSLSITRSMSDSSLSQSRGRSVMPAPGSGRIARSSCRDWSAAS